MHCSLLLVNDIDCNINTGSVAYGFCADRYANDFFSYIFKILYVVYSAANYLCYLLGPVFNLIEGDHAEKENVHIQVNCQ